MVVGVVLLIIGLLGIAGGVTFDVLTLRKIMKKRKIKTIGKEQFYSLLASCGGVLVGGALAQLGIGLINGYEQVLTWYQQMFSIVGGGLLMASIYVLVNAFILRYYKKLDDGTLKKVKIVLFSSIPAILLSFLLWEEGASPAWKYPLPSGFAINGSGIQWMYPGTGATGFRLAWYGVFILIGFLVSYFISDHRFYKEFGKHGILETCLVVVFIFGILGARIWYVVGNWNGDQTSTTSFAERVAKGDWLSIFAVWEGGLTVLGGVIAGIVSGAIYMFLFRKYVPITFALDVVVPAILVAQAIGRWGNFFNHEVYGAEVAIADGWWWLPTFIQKEMGYTLAEGNIYVPLFLIEGLINLAGYFLIAYGVRAVWRKYRAPGVLAGFYLIWYGAVRMILEGFRDTTYNMGTDGSWSFWNAMVYIILGVALIGLLTVYEYVIRPKLPKKEAKTVSAEGPSEAEIEPKNTPVFEEKPEYGNEVVAEEETNKENADGNKNA